MRRINKEIKNIKTKANYTAEGILFLGILGVLCGIAFEWTPPQALISGLIGSTLGGILGYYVGKINFFYTEKYQTQQLPTEQTNQNLNLENKEKNHVQAHPKNQASSEDISKSLTQWFESNKERSSSSETRLNTKLKGQPPKSKNTPLGGIK